MTTAARAIFDRLDWPRLQEMLGSKEPESLHLDYISAGAYKKNPDFNWDNISKPLGGFANAEGGVILYGVRCEGKNAGRDIPKELDGPIPDGLRDAITEYASRYVSPPLEGIDFKPIEDVTTKRSALAVLVPASSRKPHASYMDGYYIYYRRFDDDIKPLDHAGVDALFRSRIGQELNHFPLLQVHREIRIEERRLDVSFVNMGNAPAINLTAHVRDKCVGGLAVLGTRGSEWTIHYEYGGRDYLVDIGAAGVEDREKLVLRYQDLARARYVLTFTFTRQADNRKRIVLAPRVMLERDGVALTDP